MAITTEIDQGDNKVQLDVKFDYEQWEPSSGNDICFEQSNAIQCLDKVLKGGGLVDDTFFGNNKILVATKVEVSNANTTGYLEGLTEAYSEVLHIMQPHVNIPEYINRMGVVADTDHYSKNNLSMDELKEIIKLKLKVSNSDLEEWRNESE